MSEEKEPRRLISAITAYSVPKHIVLFGSRAKGLARSESDFDATPARPLFRGFIDHPVPGYPRSLLDILQDPPIDPGLLHPIVD